MIRGIEIIYNNDHDYYIWYKLFKDTPINDLCFFIHELDPREQRDTMGDKMKGSALLDVLSKPHYIVSTIMSAYEHDIEEIVHFKTINDYLESECKLIIFCYDVCYFDIFSKDEAILKHIEMNCKKHKLQYELVDETTTGRTDFDMC